MYIVCIDYYRGKNNSNNIDSLSDNNPISNTWHKLSILLPDISYFPL